MWALSGLTVQSTALLATAEVFADPLYYTSIPTSVVHGANFSITVTAKNPGTSTTDSAFTGVVQLTLMTGGVTLSGTTSVNAVAGVATFTGLSLSGAAAYPLDAMIQAAEVRGTAPNFISNQFVTQLIHVT